MLNIANALEEDGATYYELQPLYDKALNLAIEAGNPRLKANTINSLAVLHETNGEHEKSSKFSYTAVHFVKKILLTFVNYRESYG